MRVREETDMDYSSRRESEGSPNINLFYTFWRADHIDSVLLKWVGGLVTDEWYKSKAITFRESIMIPQVRRSQIDFRGGENSADKQELWQVKQEYTEILAISRVGHFLRRFRSSSGKESRERNQGSVETY